MMKKGERTRRRILECSAPVFNTKGFFGASMHDLVLASGLEKGGIYNHFRSKEQLALESFDYAVEVMGGRFREALEGKDSALERLFAIVDVLGALAEDPPVPGGCPVLNTAVESDGAHPALKERAAEAMSGWLRLVGREVKEGVKSGELSPGTDPRSVASVVVATLEGAVMLSRLEDDPEHMRKVVRHLKDHLRSLAREGV
jgi:TetR/AcrR family transcriptional regulator, transcriptional repressor for nem operon